MRIILIRFIVTGLFRPFRLAFWRGWQAGIFVWRQNEIKTKKSVAN